MTLELPANNAVLEEAEAKRLCALGLIEIHATVHKRAIALKHCRARKALCAGTHNRRFVIAHEDGRYSAATITPWAPELETLRAAEGRGEEANLNGTARRPAPATSGGAAPRVESPSLFSPPGAGGAP